MKYQKLGFTYTPWYITTPHFVGNIDYLHQIVFIGLEQFSKQSLGEVLVFQRFSGAYVSRYERPSYNPCPLITICYLNPKNQSIVLLPLAAIPSLFYGNLPTRCGMRQATGKLLAHGGGWRSRDRTTWSRGGGWYGRAQARSSPRYQTWGMGVCRSCPTYVFPVLEQDICRIHR